MDFFRYQKKDLFCEGVSVAELSEKIGTPFYLYSYATLKHHFEVFDGAFARIPHLVCFSVKVNSNIALLKLFFSLGGGADIVSGGELFRALQAGVDPQKVVFSGVGKTREEMSYALKSGILLFNVESPQELHVLNDVARELDLPASIAIRVNPDIDPKTHPYIATGLKQSKFGVDWETASRMYTEALKLSHIRVKGIDCHIGSQVTEVEPFVEALNKLKAFIVTLKKKNVDIEWLDLGGGVGITYDQEEPPHPSEYAEAIIREMDDLDCCLILEPGRVIAGNGGVLVTRVLYEKVSDGKHFYIVDAAMNDLIRPSLYGSYHGLLPVSKGRRKKIQADVVGPICESGDFFARDREMNPLKPGELVAIQGAGGYGFVMSSNYNSRPRVPEVLVKENRSWIIREKETYEDLIQKECIPKFLEKS